MLNFIPLDKDGFELFKNWFSEQETTRRIAPPDQNWFDYATHNPHVFAWTIWENDHCIAQLQLDIDEDQVGYIDIVVNPIFRNQGYGKRVVQQFLEMPKHPSVKKIEAHIEPDNLPSIALFRSLGFKQIKNNEDDDEFWVFVY